MRQKYNKYGRKRADDIVDEANQKAAQESLNKIKIAEQEIEQLANKVKSDLKMICRLWLSRELKVF
ncbi:MAG: hypothetical protein CM15mP93_04120 [Thiotrichaceae bacterium]|nr:MAG: hypothetical protein CM15mP93_04120 [Thiotrichaceae bacterium]